MSRPTTVPQPPQQAIDHAGAHLPEPMELPEFPGFPNAPAGDGPPSSAPLPFAELDLPDDAHVNTDFIEAHVPDFILDGF